MSVYSRSYEALLVERLVSVGDRVAEALTGHQDCGLAAVEIDQQCARQPGLIGRRG
jgi:hypothetical protein